MSPGLLLLILRVAMGIVLFAFLITVLVMLRHDLRLPVSPTLAVPPARLVSMTNSAAEQAFSLENINLIGRAADNTIVLDEEVVSAHHARLSYLSGQQWWLEDLGSRNGTLVNGVPLEHPIAVTEGDEITFGTYDCRLVSGQGEA